MNTSYYSQTFVPMLCCKFRYCGRHNVTLWLLAYILHFEEGLLQVHQPARRKFGCSARAIAYALFRTQICQRQHFPVENTRATPTGDSNQTVGRSRYRQSRIKKLYRRKNGQNQTNNKLWTNTMLVSYRHGLDWTIVHHFRYPKASLRTCTKKMWSD